MIILSIDLRKIDQSKCKSHTNGAKYCELVVMERRDGEDQYGNTHMVVQGVTKEEREAGIKGPILGNGREKGQKSAKPAPPAQRPAQKVDPDLDPAEESGRIPF